MSGLRQKKIVNEKGAFYFPDCKSHFLEWMLIIFNLLVYSLSNNLWIYPQITENPTECEYRRLECNVTTLNALFRGLKGSIYKPENLFMLITESKKKNAENELYFGRI